MNDQITIIPLDDEALHSVTTPFVAFEHGFKTRIAWVERMLEAFKRVTARVLLGDTWPDAQHDPISWGRVSEKMKVYDHPQTRYDLCFWPETAIYYTGVAQMYHVDPTIKYRPHMHFFGQYFDACTVHARRICKGDDIDASPEGIIYVDDRNIYPVEYPALSFPPIEQQLSIVAVGQQITRCERDAQVVHVSDDPSVPLGARFNEALSKTTGEWIVVLAGGYVDVGERIDKQLADNADLSMGAVDVRSGKEMWIPYGYSQTVDEPTGQLATMMFRRRVFQKLGGMCESMSVGFDYDLYLRLLADRDLSLAYHTEPLVEGSAYDCPYGRAYTQNVYNDAANRIRYTKGYHGRSIQREHELA